MLLRGGILARQAARVAAASSLAWVALAGAGTAMASTERPQTPPATASVQSVADVERMMDEEARARRLFKRVRCPASAVCTIEQSETDMAAVLRRAIRECVARGMMDDEVLASLSQRFGPDIVAPPVDYAKVATKVTVGLGAFLMLVVGWRARRV